MVHSNGLVCESASEKRQAFQGPSLIFGKGKVLAQGKCCVQGCGDTPQAKRSEQGHRDPCQALPFPGLSRKIAGIPSGGAGEGGTENGGPQVLVPEEGVGI